MNPGIIYATLAYMVWGLFPLYFRQIADVPALEVVMHRTVWSLLFVVLLLLVLKRWAWIGQVVRQPKVLGAFALSALLLSSNWLIYVWAVQNQHVLDASLGYFILPLVNVTFAYAFLGERPRRGQWMAVALAALGVVWLTVQTGRLPWVALALALTFGFYGLLRKVAVLGALEGLTLETMMLAPFALAYLVYGVAQGDSVLLQANASALGWLAIAGPLTAIPLLLFAAGARRIPMTTLGILQYVSPSILFLLSVTVFNESLQLPRLVGFALIWGALVVYSLEGLVNSRRVRLVQARGVA
ncbi:EamA family transporter RarD [Rhodoferax sp. AJA081-3]|uniref:EamA family transporter RarD n=1 Tax=Rhodoferax sp. AJA081-3 TaxID=2752316 RepID=UPI001ADF657C|nr:EamA family transporter RarD [Rhodoferax sp. AJA081-3]QTN27200.1 EamA family transporter RarD [Rhodoferax sp. AJA081-3]